MDYLSTRDKTLALSAAEAIKMGLSRDGGLFTPARFPSISPLELEVMCEMSYQQRCAYVMGLFLDDFTPEEVSDFALRAYGPEKFDDPAVAPLRRVGGKTWCLELWHGPTSAFKDMALQMLPQLLSASLKKTGEDKTACILVATSGDTGKAAMEGFADVPQTKILVFYPENGVSQIQKLQMVTQEGANVGVCAVRGNFDDAQNGVKRVFSDPAIREELAGRGFFLSSANSINWGRILPQIVYYISAYCDLLREGEVRLGEPVNYCVPTGNFGNILACYYARKMGLPVGKLICASNRNDVLTEFIRTGVYDRNRPFHTTMSPSMDILISSNLERLLFDLSGGDDALVRSYMEQLQKTGRYAGRRGAAGKAPRPLLRRLLRGGGHLRHHRRPLAGRLPGGHPHRCGGQGSGGLPPGDRGRETRCLRLHRQPLQVLRQRPRRHRGGARQRQRGPHRPAPGGLRRASPQPPGGFEGEDPPV